MVRLRLSRPFNSASTCFIFTIHYGEIKTIKIVESALKRINLQSTMVRLRRGPEKSRTPSRCYLQSTMVRLRLACHSTTHFLFLYLQSTMVRLRRLKSLERPIPFKLFTIHYGEIKTKAFFGISSPSKVNLQSTMVRLRQRVKLFVKVNVSIYNPLW